MMHMFRLPALVCRKWFPKFLKGGDVMEYISPEIKSLSSDDLKEIISVNAASPCPFMWCPLPGSYQDNSKFCTTYDWSP